MIVHEDGGTIDVPLTEEWTVVDEPSRRSATRLADGRLAVDLAFLATPHRLEIELDPARPRSPPAGRSSRCSAPAWTSASPRCARRPSERGRRPGARTRGG